MTPAITLLILIAQGKSDRLAAFERIAVDSLIAGPIAQTPDPLHLEAEAADCLLIQALMVAAEICSGMLAEADNILAFSPDYELFVYMCAPEYCCLMEPSPCICQCCS
jgi:hypothetical protein